MPVDTMASAISRNRPSLTLQRNLFQLFHPIGGVRARPFSSANAELDQPERTSRAIRPNFMAAQATAVRVDPQHGEALRVTVGTSTTIIAVGSPGGRPNSDRL